MKSFHSIWFVPAAVVGSLLATAAVGQIDHRVNRGNTATGGRALDSNPNASGRFNITRPGINDPGAMSNAIISGNVTGLGGFKDYSPIPQSNQFRESLPSAGLSNFQARSVGMPEVAANRTLAPTYYFGTAETVPNAGQIQQGLNAPGSANLITPYTPPPTIQTQDKSTKELKSLIRSPEDRRIGIVPAAPDVGLSQRTIVPLSNDRASRTADSPYGAAMGSSIFGTPPPADYKAQKIPDGAPLPEGLPWQNRVTLTEEESAAAGDLETANPRIRQGVDQSQLREPIDELSADRQRRGLTQQPLDPSAESKAPQSGPVPMPSNLGDDRFADLYNAVELAQRYGARDLGFAVAPSPVPSEPGESDDSSRQKSGMMKLMRKPSEGLNQLAGAAKWAKDVVDDPLRSFVGKYRDRLNQYMATGESALREGKYYNAAQQFDLAAAVDPMNPLPLLARGHAFIAAGDYISAVQSIEQGIRRFPQIAAFRIDLPGLVGQHDVFDIRRADLESKLTTTDSPELRFLLGYIELYSGLPEEGLRNLDRAAKLAPPESPIAIFADLVSGRRELPQIGK